MSNYEPFGSKSIATLLDADYDVGKSVLNEASRQNSTIELIASENFTSPAVLAAMGSILTNKYAEGYPYARYYGGCTYIDEIEDLALRRATTLFGAEHANVQPHSGAQANAAAYMALMKPGDTLLGMGLAAGGHLTHGYKITASGTFYNAVNYGVTPEGYIDYDQVRDLALQHCPRVIVAGASAYPRFIDWAAFRAIADEVGAYLMVDMAHIAGLVAAGLHPSPVPYADIVTTTTQKTLRGPRGGMILCTNELAKAVDRAVFPGTQGGPLEHVIAGKAVMLGEALKPSFVEYQKQVIANAATLADALTQNGFDLMTKGTDNHLMLVNLRNTKWNGADAERALESIGITVNKNAIPFDPLPPKLTSGLRLGTPAVTTRGLTEPDMRALAVALKMCLLDECPAQAANLAREIKKHLTPIGKFCL